MFNEWNFDNTYTKLPKIFHKKTNLENFPSLQIILKNNGLLSELDINHNNFDKLLIDTIKNNEGNLNSFSQAYAGHQFGNFTILGDGRAILLGEHLNANNKRFDINTKGSGRTPFSRNGDGKGTLKSMIREFIISESMHGLNIKTTRSLAVIKTGESILRNSFEQGGILIRVAKSHIRVGTFQFASITKEKENIKLLIDYTIKRLNPELINEEDKYLKFFEKITNNQLDLILDWQRVGFIHGVMNTDNMSISGETIDYGPCAFLDEYNPEKVFSSIDYKGRYSFNNQPKIATWNLARLAETFLFLINEDEKIAIKKIEGILINFQNKYKILWLNMMRNKIGINNQYEEDSELINELLDLMHIFKLDYTNTFIEIEKNNLNKFDFMRNWNKKLKDRKKLNLTSDINKIINPTLIPRNHIIEKLINEAEKDSFNNINKFLELIRDPYNRDIPDEFTREPNNEEKIHQTFCGT